MARWERIGDEAMAISVITYSEIIYGLSLKQSEKLSRAFDHVLRGRFPLFPVTQEIADDFGRLKAYQQKKGKKLADLDLLIASTARIHRLVLVTLNLKDFSRIEGMIVEDWSQ